VPEFSTIAMMVMALSIAAVLAFIRLKAQLKNVIAVKAS